MRRAPTIRLGLSALLALLLCGTAVAQSSPAADKSDTAARAEGMASYYSDRLQGQRTATRERYDKNALTAASNRFPLGARVRVTNLKNKKSVVVRINDRMLDDNPRLIDVSRRAATDLGFHRAGIARVRVEALASAEAKTAAP